MHQALPLKFIEILEDLDNGCLMLAVANILHFVGMASQKSTLMSLKCLTRLATISTALYSCELGQLYNRLSLVTP